MINDMVASYTFAMTKGLFDFKSPTAPREYSYFLVVLFILMAASAELALYFALFNGHGSFKMISLCAGLVVFALHSVAFVSILHRRMIDTGRYKSNLLLFIIVLLCFLSVVRFKGMVLTTSLLIFLILLLVLIIRLCFVRSALLSGYESVQLNSNKVSVIDDLSKPLNNKPKAASSFDVMSIFDSRQFAVSRYSNQIHIRHSFPNGLPCQPYRNVTGLFLLNKSSFSEFDLTHDIINLNLNSETYYRYVDDAIVLMKQNPSVSIQDCLVVVVVTPSSSTTQAADYYDRIYKLGVTGILIFINVCPHCDSDSVIDLYEMELRSELNCRGYGFYDCIIKATKLNLS